MWPVYIGRWMPILLTMFLPLDHRVHWFYFKQQITNIHISTLQRSFAYLSFYFLQMVSIVHFMSIFSTFYEQYKIFLLAKGSFFNGIRPLVPWTSKLASLKNGPYDWSSRKPLLNQKKICVPFFVWPKKETQICL